MTEISAAIDSRTCWGLGRDIDVELVCPDQDEASRISRLWRKVFCLELRPESHAVGNTIGLDYRLHERGWKPAAKGDRLYTSPGLDIWRTHGGFLLESNSSFLSLDPARSRADGALDPGFWSLPLQYQRGFFALGFLLLLSTHRFYGLHAGGVEGAGLSFLVVGDSGCGKTTTTMTLARNGWRYLSDDAVILHDTNGPVEALALSRGFSCTAQTFEQVPDLQSAGSRSEAVHGGKRLVSGDSLFPGRFVAETRPGVLLFPEIAPAAKSHLIPLHGPEALSRLIRQSPGVLSDRAAVGGQLDILRRLVETTRSFRLILGSDVHHQPQALGGLLETIAA